MDDLIAERRVFIREFAPELIVPTGHVFARLGFAQLARYVARLNEPGRFPPGLRATVNHLVLRAAARALERHPHFNDFYLTSGRAKHNQAVAVRIPLDARGKLGFSVISDAARRDLDELVVDAAARCVEDRILAERKADKLVRMRRSWPLLGQFFGAAFLTPMTWLKDYVPAVENWMAERAIRRTGTFAVSNVGTLGVTRVSSTLVAAAVADVFVCAPETRQVDPDDGQARSEMLSVGVSFDLRLFEPYEAAAFLRDMIELLAEPEQRLV
ncbi:MAG: 2-oxo acid dehydrogenase subunit E2 [Deltaproteobacteria bacterium]|nr:2-oxo acid dehydrogenase subunit E2 [Deltaproteobacteria bacterium]